MMDKFHGFIVISTQHQYKNGHLKDGPNMSSEKIDFRYSKHTYKPQSLSPLASLHTLKACLTLTGRGPSLNNHQANTGTERERSER